MNDIEKLLDQSDKAEILEFVQRLLPDAERAIVVIATPDGEGRLHFKARQLGHKYAYEITGFLSWIENTLDWSDE